RVVTTATELTFNNRDNGVYVLTVQALDRAGNLSPPSTIALGLERYQVVTRVDYTDPPVPDSLGNVAVTIHGRGFVENGPITKVILDRNHRAPPWDIEVDPASLKVTDRLISGITMDTTRDPGEYRVGLLQVRPSGETVLYFAPVRFSFEPAGTVKIGNFQVLLPTWVAGPSPQYLFSFNALVVLLVVALLAAIGILTFRKVISLAQEGAAVRAEVLALLEGRPNPRWEERKRRMQELKRRGIGLRLKFTLLMAVLATIIVLIVSVPLGFTMVGQQRTTLARGLQNSANILMGALSSSAQIQIAQLSEGFFGAVGISSLRSTMPEAVYTTITGPLAHQVSDGVYKFQPNEVKEGVWDSDEKRFADEIKAGTFKIAQETVGDELSRTVVPDLQKKVDTEAAAKLQSLVGQYRDLRGQLAALQGKTDTASRGQFKAKSDQAGQVIRDINAQARAAFAAAGTLEPFDPSKRLRPTYLFYRPVVFYRYDPQVANDTFYQGMIRLEVRTDSINRQIDEAIRRVILIAGIVALGAIALGIIGAIILANFTVTPIRTLARGVAKIRDTDDKEQLHDYVIEVKTRDEIGTLADTVNEMTQGLVTAAKANKLLLEGIDVQRRFLPLVKDRSGEPSSTAEEDNPRMEIFGYYKGAKGVSGDYFDFKRLDDTHYAVIKCDVSGKGVAAALIMVEVATLFSTYFKEWPKRKENIVRIKDPAERTKALKELERLEPLVYQINETLDERSFKGRFAALIVCLFNSATGSVTICNAGDTVANLYSVQQKSMVHIQLPSAPAAGTFPNFMVEMKNPFRQVQQKLDPGDVLFLNTDGFEESKRPLRGPDFRVLENKEEDFTPARIDAIINAVFNRGRYVLERKENPIPGEELVFDFSSCKGTVKEAVLALVSVEKVYRLSPRPLPGHEDRVKVEDKVAGFLKEHFLQYPDYFGHPLDGEQKGVLTFTNVSEEDQYDDLTIMALRRK
ncbi:MAG TPA: SpoIIE family protein phosphatase, partial [Spirochaetia bacterium]|nr:SpoIIE family protein phosphatase [Spirochaetia bacterium]